QYNSKGKSIDLSAEQVEKIIIAATKAPSGGNCQPWKFIYSNSRLFIFHDQEVSYSFLDFNSYGAYIALGAAIENVCIKSDEIGFEADIDYSALQTIEGLVAIVSFKYQNTRRYSQQLSDSIEAR